ncbi:hypothetical protein JKY72_01400 [Candidatus Gracilibacteria bacterium]|nr:hypothetical protein [Candidatus Gracilibacteria bacterium]
MLDDAEIGPIFTTPEPFNTESVSKEAQPFTSKWIEEEGQLSGDAYTKMLDFFMDTILISEQNHEREAVMTAVHSTLDSVLTGNDAPHKKLKVIAELLRRMAKATRKLAKDDKMQKFIEGQIEEVRKTLNMDSGFNQFPDSHPQ